MKHHIVVTSPVCVLWTSPAQMACCLGKALPSLVQSTSTLNPGFKTQNTSSNHPRPPDYAEAAQNLPGSSFFKTKILIPQVWALWIKYCTEPPWEPDGILPATRLKNEQSPARGIFMMPFPHLPVAYPLAGTKGLSPWWAKTKLGYCVMEQVFPFPETFLYGEVM